MEEMREHATEIQTNTAMFASQIHKEKEGGTVNTDTQSNLTEDHACLGWHVALAGLSGRILMTDANPQLGSRRGHVAGVGGSCLP